MRATVLLRNRRARTSPVRSRAHTLPFHFLHIVCVSIKEVGHGVFDCFMLESRRRSKDSHIGDSGTQLSHRLALEVKHKKWVTRESHHLTTSLAGCREGFLNLPTTDLSSAGFLFVVGAELGSIRCLNSTSHLHLLGAGSSPQF